MKHTTLFLLMIISASLSAQDLHTSFGVVLRHDDPLSDSSLFDLNTRVRIGFSPSPVPLSKINMYIGPAYTYAPGHKIVTGAGLDYHSRRADLLFTARVRTQGKTPHIRYFLEQRWYARAYNPWITRANFEVSPSSTHYSLGLFATGTPYCLRVGPSSSVDFGSFWLRLRILYEKNTRDVFSSLSALIRF